MWLGQASQRINDSLRNANVLRFVEYPLPWTFEWVNNKYITLSIVYNEMSSVNRDGGMEETVKL